MQFKSINPHTGQNFETYEGYDQDRVDTKLDKAWSAFLDMKKENMDERASKLNHLADLLEQNTDTHAIRMVREIGKPITQARAEIEKCAWVCRYYAEHAASFLEDSTLDAEDKGTCFQRHQPLGPVLAIMPWNFPFWQVFRFAAPNIMAGNPGLLKHASSVPGSALAIEDLFRKAGFAEGVFQTLLIDGSTASDLIEDERIRAVTLTGSETAGSKVAQAAGKAIKPSVLELGGSDAFIVMEDADIDEAIKTGVKARIQNNGQSCIAAKRFIIHKPVYERFRDEFADRLTRLKIGDPEDDETELGPLVSREAASTLMDQVSETLQQGARAVLGPRHTDHAQIHPGLLENIPEDTPGYDDELFGPVALFFSAEDLDQAIQIANNHRYGLGASFWSGNEDAIQTAASQIEAGSTYVNQMVASDPRLPFGGMKKSGYGRELARAGILEFMNTKTIAIAD